MNLLSYARALRRYAGKHLFISSIAVVVIIGGGWFAYAKATAPSTAPSYVLGTVSTSTIVASVSESGQVSTTNSIDIKPQVSGTITWVGVKAGQTVRAGQALASIDNTTALQAIADAKRTLAADKLSYQQSTAQAPINYQNDQQALATAQDNLANDYNTAYNDLSNTYLDLPSVMTQANDILYGYDFDTHKGQWNMDFLLNLFPAATVPDLATLQSFHDAAKNNYATANTAYTAAVGVYKTTTRASDGATVDALLGQSISMTTAAAQALQSGLNFYGNASDLSQTYTNSKLPASFPTVQSATRTSLSTVNSDLSTLLNDKKTLDSAKQAIIAAQQAITLDQVGNPNGDNPISLQISQNSIQKEEEDLANQEADLAKYTIVAPFAGTLSAVSAQPGDSAGSAAVATIVSHSQIAQLSVNEVDAAKLKLGDKATLTFDAIDGLTLTGTVAEMDPVGTVSQGVVSYTVQISFDTQDPRIKPGMTVNADIQTAIAQDVLAVPQAAVKTVNGSNFVQVFNPPIPQAQIDAAGSAGVTSSVAPTLVPVTTGISDDTTIEITSGLVAGQQIVVGTRSGTTKPAASATTGASRGGNAGFGGGGAIRIGG
jgi:multidrug efflux pump subunit AcrA (membrane-fusion protein)